VAIRVFLNAIFATVSKKRRILNSRGKRARGLSRRSAFLINTNISPPQSEPALPALVHWCTHVREIVKIDHGLSLIITPGARLGHWSVFRKSFCNKKIGLGKSDSRGSRSHVRQYPPKIYERPTPRIQRIQGLTQRIRGLAVPATVPDVVLNQGAVRGRSRDQRRIESCALAGGTKSTVLALTGQPAVLL
jgi:hypothetical protein